MNQLKYNTDQLPGENYYRHFINNIESKYQASYRLYQEWRMQVGRPMTDIDCLISSNTKESFNNMRNLEYDYINNQPTNFAILEMKHFRTPDQTIQYLLDHNSPNSVLADSAKLPFFIIKYFPAPENKDMWEFSVYPKNQFAKDILKTSTHMSERRFIQFLYADLRKMPIPKELLEKANPQKNSLHFSQLI